MRLFQAVEQSRWNLALPEGARQMMGLQGSPRAQRSWLQRWLQTEPKLGERVIRWSNSPLFNLSRQFSQLQQVLAVLGEQQTMRLALLASIRTRFLPNLRIQSYAREQLWRHSVAVGAVSGLVARVCNVPDHQTAFVAGALHDVGLLASERADPNAFANLLGELDALTDTAATERHRYGWDHQVLGAQLLRRWGFQQSICDVARFHHQAHRGAEAEDEQLLYCVVVADYLCSRCGWTELGLHNIAQPADSVFNKLGIDHACLTILWKQLYATLEHTRPFI
ncbi:HDOD domain-containing protein [Roseimaritima ulvae]|uniref:HDOD domain protein n=1 Tax=Roseimaritima ulvae TaxID=980254 RepID=A0A5B9QWI8_9BACT|nr:HDOD domain-containing protein [Roseimaritima ulvae]QEG42352.1 HDOD domain protein [Roseimaritima ulvae]